MNFPGYSIILFDGVCNVCNSSVNTVIRNDKHNRFKFAPLESETGQKLLKQYQLTEISPDSFVLIENNKAYIKSTAALRVVKHLSKLYPLLYGFIIVPPFIRNWVYDWFAKNRYKFFGKKESCMIPTPEVRSKFIS